MSETTPGYEALPRARLTRQGQITVPKAVRDALGAIPGDDLVFERQGEEIVLRHRPRRSVLAMAGAAADTAPAGGLSKPQLVASLEAEVGRGYAAKAKRIAEPLAAASASRPRLRSGTP